MRRLGRTLAWIGGVTAFVVSLAGAWAAFWTYYNPRVPLAEPRVVHRPHPGADPVTIVLGGDFGPTDAALPMLREHGYHYPYEATAEILRGADLAFANLESPVTLSTDRFPLYKDFIYKVDPKATEAWQWLGLDLVSIANNHISDYRDQGVLDTVHYLDAAGIEHVGAGDSESAARRPVIFDVGGTRIGFLGYLEDRPIYTLYLRTFAIGDRVGCAQLNQRDLEEDVRRLRPLVDILIVSVHWGNNYADVTAHQEAFAHELASLGVDVVAGHHPHNVQAVQLIGRTVVLYSLGNYAWGAPGHDELRIGFLARLGVTPRRGPTPPKLGFVELQPIVTQNEIVKFQPRPLGYDEQDWVAPFLAASRARGSTVELDGTVVRVALP